MEQKFIPPTLESLQTLKKAKDDELERRNLAISLKICPICGAPLIEENLEVFDKPKSYFFGIVKIFKKLWDYRTICSKDKVHYENKGDYYGD
jgi:hypothetical protein